MAATCSVTFEADDFFESIAKTFTWRPSVLTALGVEALVELFHNGRYLFLRDINTKQPLKDYELYITDAVGDRILESESSYWGPAQFYGFDMEKVYELQCQATNVVITVAKTASTAA